MKRTKKPKHKPVESLDTMFEIQVAFVVNYELRDRKTFQETEGRFLPALRPRNQAANIQEDGFNLEAAQSQSQYREWGDEVHIVRLAHPQDPKKNIIRKLSDSQEDAVMQAKQEIPRVLAALSAAKIIQDHERESLDKVCRERNSLRDFVLTKFDQGTLDRALGGQA